MTYQRHSHCSFCGTPFPVDLAWPRHCSYCNNISYVNPLPVVVVLVPVDDGLLVVRRNIPPQLGKLALPGGFIDLGETWQEAGAREVYEEARLEIDPTSMREFLVRSTPEGLLLVFGLAAPMQGRNLPPFVANSEASERLVAYEPLELAFPLHYEAMRAYFAK
jgi:ADP-ribose pyrophosphatase YjhB (NUDIX family)